MDQPLLVCINKVMHQEPVFFNTVDEKKTHWQPCLGLSLVAKPATAQVAKGKGRTPEAKVDIGKAGTSTQTEAGTSTQVNIGKADKSDVQMLDVDDNVVVETESAVQSAKVTSKCLET